MTIKKLYVAIYSYTQLSRTAKKKLLTAHGLVLPSSP